MRITIVSNGDEISFQDNVKVIELINFLNKYELTSQSVIELLNETIEEIKHKTNQIKLVNLFPTQ